MYNIKLYTIYNYVQPICLKKTKDEWGAKHFAYISCLYLLHPYCQLCTVPRDIGSSSFLNLEC